MKICNHQFIDTPITYKNPQNSIETKRSTNKPNLKNIKKKKSLSNLKVQWTQRNKEENE